jgi:ribose 5-phosphate isomerase B
MRIAIAADHNGVAWKAHLVDVLRAKGHEVNDRGAHDSETIVDYPPLCADLCRRVTGGHADRGIVIGGSGGGEAIACNKIPGIRAGLCHSLLTAEISRANNNSNVLIVGTKIIPLDLAEEITLRWLVTEFTGGRHQRRLDQIAALERGELLI